MSNPVAQEIITTASESLRYYQILGSLENQNVVYCKPQMLEERELSKKEEISVRPPSYSVSTIGKNIYEDVSGTGLSLKSHSWNQSTYCRFGVAMT